jgi:uncharacterized protein
MVIAVCKVTLHLPENSSLKGKRRVLKSLIGRVQNHFPVSIAEVGDNDLWQLAELGVAYVSNDPQHANEVLSKVVDFISNSSDEALMTGYELEILHAL